MKKKEGKQGKMRLPPPWFVLYSVVIVDVVALKHKTIAAAAAARCCYR